MRLSQNTGEKGLVQMIDWELGTDNTSYPVADKVRQINEWLKDTVKLIRDTAQDQQFDDFNFTTDIPIAEEDLVSGTQSYILNQDMDLIEKVEILDPEGNARELDPIDLFDIPGGTDDYYSVDGTPVKYDKKYNRIYLYPAPNYNKTDGLILHYLRGASLFEVPTDVTDDAEAANQVEAGFNTAFHKILALGAAFDYARRNELDTKMNALNLAIAKETQRIVDHYSKHSKDRKTQFIGRPQQSR